MLNSWRVVCVKRKVGLFFKKKNEKNNYAIKKKEFFSMQRFVFPYLVQWQCERRLNLKRSSKIHAQLSTLSNNKRPLSLPLHLAFIVFQFSNWKNLATTLTKNPDRTSREVRGANETRLERKRERRKEKLQRPLILFSLQACGYVCFIGVFIAIGIGLKNSNLMVALNCYGLTQCWRGRSSSSRQLTGLSGCWSLIDYFLEEE